MSLWVYNLFELISNYQSLVVQIQNLSSYNIVIFNNNIDYNTCMMYNI